MKPFSFKGGEISTQIIILVRDSLRHSDDYTEHIPGIMDTIKINITLETVSVLQSLDTQIKINYTGTYQEIE